jgi:hypothetical protein
VDSIDLVTNETREPIFVDVLVVERAKGKRGDYLVNLLLVRKKRITQICVVVVSVK